jgi:hypothetical protein
LEKPSAKNSGSSQKPSRPAKPNASPTSEMLTPSELQSLKQEAKETSAFAAKAFAHLKPKKT